MNARNRFGAGALMGLALALCTGGAAVADILVPPPDSPSPGASGTAQTTYDTSPSISGELLFGIYGIDAETKFQVSGLRPRTTYTFSVVDEVSWAWWLHYEVSFKTNGRGKASGLIQWLSPSPGTAVYTVVDGSDIVVLVGQE